MSVWRCVFVFPQWSQSITSFGKPTPCSGRLLRSTPWAPTWPTKSANSAPRPRITTGHQSTMKHSNSKSRMAVICFYSHTVGFFNEKSLVLVRSPDNTTPLIPSLSLCYCRKPIKSSFHSSICAHWTTSVKGNHVIIKVCSSLLL